MTRPRPHGSRSRGGARWRTPPASRPSPGAPAVVKIVYFTFRGLFADNPRAIYEALLARDDLELTHTWLCTAKTRPTLPGRRARRSIYGTPEAAAALERADVVIANDCMSDAVDEAARRRPTCRPGTARRSSGSTTTSAGPPGLARRPRPGRRPLGPPALPQPGQHPAAAARLPASRPGPRDRLPAQRRPEPPRRATRSAPRVRAELGIPDGTTAVLYAPTWRDDLVFDTAGGTDFEVPIDLADFAERLGERPRAAAPAAQHGRRPARDPDPARRCVDVSDRADIARSCTWPPTCWSPTTPRRCSTSPSPASRMVFFTYDLEHYRDDAARLLLRPGRGRPRPARCAPARNSSRRSPTSPAPPPAPPTGTRGSATTFCSLEDGARDRPRARPALPARRPRRTIHHRKGMNRADH